MPKMIKRGMLRGALIGLLVGIGLAAVYLIFGLRGNERTEFLAYSLVLVGFPVVWAVSPVLKWVGLQGGLGEYVGLVLLSLPLNGSLWGACFGSLLGLLDSQESQ